MEHWTDAQWQAEERQQPGKTYIKPEMKAFFRDCRGLAATVCFVLAVGVGSSLWLNTSVEPVLAGGWDDQEEQAQREGRDIAGSGRVTPRSSIIQSPSMKTVDPSDDPSRQGTTGDWSRTGGDDSCPCSGGVGDKTGHTAQMNDKAR